MITIKYQVAESVIKSELIATGVSGSVNRTEEVDLAAMSEADRKTLLANITLEKGESTVFSLNDYYSYEASAVSHILNSDREKQERNRKNIVGYLAGEQTIASALNVYSRDLDLADVKSRIECMTLLSDEMRQQVIDKFVADTEVAEAKRQRNIEESKAREERKKAETAEREQKRKAAIEELRVWAVENGSELVKVRIEIGKDWIELAERERNETKLVDYEFDYYKDIDTDEEDEEKTVSKPNLELSLLFKQLMRQLQDENVECDTKMVYNNYTEKSTFFVDVCFRGINNHYFRVYRNK